MTYDYEGQLYRFNTITFVEKIELTGYYWIAMAYCFAIEPMVYDPPLGYTVE